MNLRRLFVLFSLLWLAGCATTTPDVSTPAIRISNSTPSGTTLSPLSTSLVTGKKVASLAPPADLWERIRKGFAMPQLDHNLVQDREQWYSSRPDYILRMTERSSKYLFHIVEELERRGMPSELALLPYIESAFNPQAVSSAKAAGMWQFMPATGTYFDLKQNIFRDDRRDVLASTRAALDYLEKLHGMFGDWHLALAAYNWGEGNVGRAIKRNEALGLGTGYTDLNMPAETRMYVPKLQAVKNIIANPDSFNTELPNIENHPYFQVVEMKRDMDAQLVAQLADVRVEDFRALNPSLNKPVIFAAGTPQILLPWDNAQVFRRNLAAYDDGQFASWTVWVVPNTMTVTDAAQRTGMSESDLRNVNNIPPRMLIKAGSSLMVPRTGKNLEDVSSHVADNGQISFSPEVVTVNRRTVIKVRRGDSMNSVAQRYSVSLGDLATWNNLRSNAALRAGQSLSVYQAIKVSTARAAPSRTPAIRSAAGTSSKSAVSRSTAKSKPTPKGGTPAKRKR